MVAEPKDRKSVDEMLREIMERITPAILDIYAKRDNGEVKIRFQTGDFRQARVEVAL
jgi:hypothetical protein